ncbi:dihydropteroate synthase [Virgibacillus sp. 179-BFC.A HS]|uniref:Dihydropteroate synthase n=1 Tax=Tigheibacillus jepli TaxID=3035914 RepID=A0ABU5CDE6_9BACI|nr:dihydropteroate synthase [Virgibacillus sp. 179-BFC.A HS]MDY0404021.1 dihydropteroate synthase [Virgibacillus sp. 179-BFC.A HS]
MKWQTRTKTFDLSSRTHIMGILNVTPDSFSDGGNYTTEEKAVAQALKMVQEGADVIDIGGESTRPNHQKVSVEEEIQRVIPMIQAVSAKTDTPISIDTYKAQTAKHAIEAGAQIINDVWGAKKDPEIAAVAAQYEVPIILMHNRQDLNYTNIMEDMKRDLAESIDIAVRAGVKDEAIMIDPGIGFAKTGADNLVVLRHLEELTCLGYPLLLAASRKRFLGTILDVPPAERDNGTAATTCLGITKGAQMVRVHNVKVNKEMALVMDAILRERG